MTEQLSLHFSSLSTQSLKEFLVELVIIIIFFSLLAAACSIIEWGLNPHPLQSINHWKCKVLATEWPGKPLELIFYGVYMFLPARST